MTQIPTIGRVVHVLVDPKANNGADVAPAIITRVWSGTCVNVRVLRDGYPDPAEWMTSISLHASREALEDHTEQRRAEFAAAGADPGSVAPYGAFWPPRS